jgi:hypothetical protein
MKVELDDITLSISPLTDEVFVGITRKGKPNEWKHKKNVTNEFLGAVVTRWKGFKQEIVTSEGKKFEVTVKEIEDEN